MKIDSARYSLPDGRKLTIQRMGRLIEVNVHGKVTLSVDHMDLEAANESYRYTLCRETLVAVFGLTKKNPRLKFRLPNCTAADSSEIIDAIVAFT